MSGNEDGTLITLKHNRHFKVESVQKDGSVVKIEVNDNLKSKSKQKQPGKNYYTQVKSKENIERIEIQDPPGEVKLKMQFVEKDRSKKISKKIKSVVKIKENEETMDVFFNENEKVIYLTTNPFNRILGITKEGSRVRIEYKLGEKPKTGVTFVPNYEYEIHIDGEVKKVSLEKII